MFGKTPNRHHTRFMVHPLFRCHVEYGYRLCIGHEESRRRESNERRVSLFGLWQRNAFDEVEGGHVIENRARGRRLSRKLGRFQHKNRPVCEEIKEFGEGG